MIVRVNKTKDYTVMSNCHLRDDRLSLKAKGLMSVVLSLPDDWNYSISGLVSICKESETSVKSALDELKKHGYLVIDKKMPNETQSGRYEYIYEFYEKPQKQEPCNQGVEKQPLEILPLENHPLYKNTDKSNTEEQNTDEEVIERDEQPKFTRFTPPTLEEVSDYCWERQNHVDPQKFIDHYSSNGWMVGRTKMKDWKAAVRTWEKNSFDRPKASSSGNPFTDMLKQEGYSI